MKFFFPLYGNFLFFSTQIKIFLILTFQDGLLKMEY